MYCSSLHAPCPLLLALSSLLVTSTAHAETLLATIVLRGYYTSQGSIQPAPMGFGVYPASIGTGTGFVRYYNETDVGTVYEAPTALMAGFNAGFDDPQREIGMSTMSGVANWQLTRFWEIPNNIFPSVPQLGVGLEGYDISRITQTVDYLNWFPGSGGLPTWGADGQQTIRLYGGREVPEPTTPVLIAVVIIICIILSNGARRPHFT